MRVDAVLYGFPTPDPMGSILTWEVIWVHQPDTLPASREEIMRTLAEALDVYGSTSYDTSRVMVSEVRVDFSKLRIAKFDFAKVKIKGE